MASIVEFEIQGLKETEKALGNLRVAVQKKILRQSMRESMRGMYQLVKNTTPVASGALKKSVKLRAGKRSRNGVIRVVVQLGSQQRGKRKASGNFQGEAYYGRFPEWGTKTQQAQRFLKHAYDMGANGAIARLIPEVKRRVTEAAWKG